MPIKRKKKPIFVAKKNVSIKKKIYLLFPVLIILLIIGYLFYKGNKYSIKTDKSDSHSIAGIQTKPEIEEDESLLPVIKKAKFQLESADNIDKLRIIIEETDSNKKSIRYNYEWFKNGEPFGNNTDNITGFKKNDKIDLKVTPFDDKRYGRPRLLSIEISRVTPKIVENKEISFDGNELSYQVRAIDPDGNALKYFLIDPPKGMTIDNKTGMIRWQVKNENYGKQDIKVRIASANGSEVIYPLSIYLAKVAE
ncbi:MAG: hypothetical protein NT178_00555 [Proteobacteria bacterium]|nr:hypothetical protein [Pseudomonadota bacterium]